jgi:hypothetical protein
MSFDAEKSANAASSAFAFTLYESATARPREPAT